MKGTNTSTARTAAPSRLELAFFPLHLAATSLCAIVAAAAVSLGAHEDPDSHRAVTLASGLAVVALGVYMRYVLRTPWVSASLLYLALFWVFHFGFTFVAIVFPHLLVPLADWELEWLGWPNVRKAMLLAVIGAAGFVFGAGLLKGRTAPDPAPPSETHDPALYTFGWIVMLLGVAIFMTVLAQNGGPALLSLGYLDFRRTIVDATSLSTGIDLSQIGCLIAICGARPGRWVRPLVTWSVFLGVPMLLFGLRAEVMIPLVVFLVVLTHRGVHFRRTTLVAVCVFALLVVPMVKTFRELGFANRSLVAWTELTPLDTFMELGGTLRATGAYIDWIDAGDPYLLGASYWAPLDRHLLVHVIPGRRQIPWEQDERVPLRLMDVREGPFGASATGEAYYNFGTVGPFFYFAFVGLLFGALERWATRLAYGCAFLGFMMHLFYFNIRSDWLPIPAQTFSFLLVLAGCAVAARVFPLRRASPGHAQPAGAVTH